MLGVAAWAGTGRLGEMPEPVTDRPKAHIPDGEVDQEFLDELRLPGAVTGYRRAQVDEYLAAHAAGTDSLITDPVFDVVRGGYDMQSVDVVVDRLRPAPTPLSREEFGPVVLTGDAPGDRQDVLVDAVSADDEPEVHDNFSVDDSAQEKPDSPRRDGAEEGFMGELRAP
ncbi:hypothetical protein EAX62_14665 [Tessaracoccus antarcticus]|uniref:DivIVA domain-containing protein n=1 Tax=Tessaracoccus antarcticus TaxID=2479848 RepID=A0A3M0GBK1_9ACTN|nr:hypothetical protein EAX62_14665 [Tessaracoccus antarcticus]